MLFGNNRGATRNTLDMSLLGGILDAQDTEIVVADNNCNLLLMNAAARLHALGEAASSPGESLGRCKDSISALIPTLCEHCPVRKGTAQGASADHDLQDRDGNYYAVRYSSIPWVDGTQATAMFLRDVHDERTLLDRLNSIAYIDQLTNMPNRRKLQEDFESIAENIAAGKVAGILAIFDLDHFKTINDSYGHGTGDVMLKRIANHFENDEAFRGHIYRLGGDEFVLFFPEPLEKHSSQADCQRYYAERLKGAFRSYTLPNIDVACTLSIGVSFFPWQGNQYSELLRKADIALYKAKENGRNQICFFEDRYDTAKKFKDMYISMQPLLTGEGHTFGYELVEQEHDRDAGDNAVQLHEFERTIETLGIDELESEIRYFITFANQLLNPTVAHNLKKDKFIIQVHLDGLHSDDALRKYATLHSLGYSLAFSGVNRQNAAPELFRLASFCMFDPLELDRAFRRTTIDAHPSIQFIATGVDTVSAFEQAKEQGYTLFRGHFFKQEGVVKKTKDIDPVKANYLRLLKLTSTDDYVDFDEITGVIASDVALSYKLLRLLNSAAVGLRNRITSISIAVTYLGEVNLKQWIAMLALRGLSEDKPMELIRLSLLRAHFAESLCEIMIPRRDAKHVFLTGLLSLLDVALEKSKEEVFREIPVSDEIRDSLLTEHGPYSDFVRFFTAYEYADWETVSAFAEDNMLTGEQINTAYIASVKWYNDLIDFD